MDTVKKELVGILTRHWWALLLRGLIAIAFGVLVWCAPQISLAALVLLFGAYALAGGVLGAGRSVGGECEGRRAGSMGVMGAFCFSPTDPLGTFGDTGMVTTNDSGLATCLRSLRDHGTRERAAAALSPVARPRSRLRQPCGGRLRTPVPFHKETRP